jgi:hypothetical protein
MATVPRSTVVNAAVPASRPNASVRVMSIAAALLALSAHKHVATTSAARSGKSAAAASAVRPTLLAMRLALTPPQINVASMDSV